MSTPVSGAVSWTTPVTIASGDVVASTDLNNLNKDVAFLRAKPYIIAWQTAAPTAPTLPTSSDLSTAPTNTKIVFATSNGGSVGTSSSSSSVGSFGLTSDGKFSTPTSLAGLYRFSCQMMVSAVSNGHARVSAVLYNSSGTYITVIPGTWADTGTTHNAVSTVSFTLPMNVSSSTLGNVAWVQFVGQSVGTAPTLVTLDLNSNGPASTPKQFNTAVTIEYLGTSTGAY